MNDLNTVERESYVEEEEEEQVVLNWTWMAVCARLEIRQLAETD